MTIRHLILCLLGAPPAIFRKGKDVTILGPYHWKGKKVYRSPIRRCANAGIRWVKLSGERVRNKAGWHESSRAVSSSLSLRRCSFNVQLGLAFLVLSNEWIGFAFIIFPTICTE